MDKLGIITSAHIVLVIAVFCLITGKGEQEGQNVMKLLTQMGTRHIQVDGLLLIEQAHRLISPKIGNEQAVFLCKFPPHRLQHAAYRILDDQGVPVPIL